MRLAEQEIRQLNAGGIGIVSKVTGSENLWARRLFLCLPSKRTPR